MRILLDSIICLFVRCRGGRGKSALHIELEFVKKLPSSAEEGSFA
jgi:hypothetical protein